MEIVLDNIREISLKTDFIENAQCIYRYEKEYYGDLLRVSKNWISYKRHSLDDGSERGWSYKTNKKSYLRLWDDLCCAVKYAFEHIEELKGIGKKDIGYFSLRVTFNDLTFEDINGFGTLTNFGVGEVGAIFREMIPLDEEYPGLINGNIFKRANLTKSILENIDMTKVRAMMFAEGGAMGNPGEIEIVDEDNYVYSNDSSYTKKEIEKEERITQYDVTDKFEGFMFEPGYMAPAYKTIELNNGRWMYMNLGAGNHLYLRYDFYREYGGRLLATEDPVRYGRWCVLTNR